MQIYFTKYTFVKYNRIFSLYISQTTPKLLEVTTKSFPFILMFNECYELITS